MIKPQQIFLKKNIEYVSLFEPRNSYQNTYSYLQRAPYVPSSMQSSLANALWERVGAETGLSCGARGPHRWPEWWP